MLNDYIQTMLNLPSPNPPQYAQKLYLEDKRDVQALVNGLRKARVLGEQKVGLGLGLIFECSLLLE
jgi:hypothetical protein